MTQKKMTMNNRIPQEPSMESQRKRLIFGSIVVIITLCLLWYVLSPSNRFGLSIFGITIYNRVPYLLSDIQVRTDGMVRTVQKTHLLQQNHIRWLLEPLPDVLIIATGWSGETHVIPQIRSIVQCAVEVRQTPSALLLYNRLKQEGKKVAIHVHSTC